MPFDPRQWPNAVTIGDLIRDRMGMGVHCREMRAACGHGSGQAAPGAGDAGAVAGWAVQVHALRIEADRGAAGMARAGRLVRMGRHGRTSPVRMGAGGGSASWAGNVGGGVQEGKGVSVLI